METKQSQANYIKKYRLFKRILSMLENNNNCLFLTLTFNNESLKRTTQKTRIRAIKDYLNDQAKEYILNIDYGARNQREHYHAIISPKHEIIYYKIYAKNYGLIKAEYIGKLKRFENINKTIQDIAKRLTEHSTKETTKGNKIIYGRKRKAVKDSKYINEIESQKILNEHEQEWKRYQREQQSINDGELLNDLAQFFMNRYN